MNRPSHRFKEFDFSRRLHHRHHQFCTADVTPDYDCPVCGSLDWHALYLFPYAPMHCNRCLNRLALHRLV